MSGIGGAQGAAGAMRGRAGRAFGSALGRLKRQRYRFCRDVQQVLGSAFGGAMARDQPAEQISRAEPA